MRFANKMQKCCKCGNEYDETYSECPSCKAPSDNPCSLAYRKQANVSYIKQIILFVVGWAGLSVLSTIVTAIALLIFKEGHQGLTSEELTAQFNAYIQTGAGSWSIFGFVYPILAAALCLIIWKDWPKVLKSFKGYKPYLAGAIGFVALLAANILYELLVQGICKAGGWTRPGDGNNEKAIIELLKYTPVGGIIVLSFIGPLAEEFTYRVGLFGFFSRLGKVAGYIIAIAIFAAIHIDWTAIGTNAIWAELVSLPSYIMGGLALTLVYDKFGFGASYTCHVLNNLYSMIMILIQTGSK